MDSVLSTYAYPPLRMLSKSCICPTIARNLREVLYAIFLRFPTAAPLTAQGAVFQDICKEYGLFF